MATVSSNAKMVIIAIYGEGLWDVGNPYSAWDVIEQIREGDQLQINPLGVLLVSHVVARTVRSPINGNMIDMVRLRCERVKMDAV